MPALASSAAAGRPPTAAPASATVLAAAPATASSVVPVGRAAVSVPTGPAAVVALASAPAAGSHPVSDLGAGRRDQHAVFAVLTRQPVHDWQLYVMTMDVEHVAADDVATTVRRRLCLPPRRQVGLRRRVLACGLARRRAQGDVLAVLLHGDVDGGSVMAAVERLVIRTTRRDDPDHRPFKD